MSFNRMYLARFLTSSKRQHADDLLEMGREGKIFALESFFAHTEVTRILEELPEVKIFLDSGAFSLENQEVKDTQKYLDDYIDYILKWNDRLFAYANLDAIGDVEQGWKNQKYMESRGVVPIPVYHYGEDFKWAERYVNEYEYIGVGGIARGIPAGSLRNLFDRVFDYIAQRNLGTRVHGFGVTGFKFLIRYPFYSIDSTTWLKQAGFGRIMIPRYDERRKKFNFMCTPFVVSVSDVSLCKTDTAHSHYSIAYPPQVTKRIEEYFTMIGIDSEKLKTEQAERLRANVYFYDRLQSEEAMHTLLKRQKDNRLF